MTDFANVLPWVRASVRNGAEVPAEHVAVLLAELDRRAAEITELGNKVVALSQGETSAEWGVRWANALPEEEFEPREDEHAARRLHGMYRADTEVVTREVRRGPWTQAQS